MIRALSLTAIAALTLSRPLAGRAEAQPPDDAKAKGAFRFAPVDDRSLALYEGDRPVLVYNHGTLLKQGVPQSFARSSYVHPIHGLDGEVITDDFPADHYHHRGLFWAWPHVRIGGKEYDNWALRPGLSTRFEKWLDRTASVEKAVIGVQNGWYVGPRRVLDEQVWLQAHPVNQGARSIDVELRLTPIEPVTLSGAEGKSYGGLTLRYGPAQEKQTEITVSSGRAGDDLYINRQPWVDLTRRWPGRPEPSGAALFVAKDHPDYPPTWLTRHYGCLCIGWPGVEPKTLPAGETVTLRYRVWVHRGAPDAVRIGRAYDDYLKHPPGPIAGVR